MFLILFSSYSLIGSLGSSPGISVGPVSVFFRMVGDVTRIGDVAASIAALINANTTLSALVSATVSSYTPSGGTAGTQVILTARTAGFAGAFSATVFKWQILPMEP